MTFTLPPAARHLSLVAAAILLAAGGPAPERRTVPRAQVAPAAAAAPASEPAPVPGPMTVAAPAAATMATPDLSGLSPGDRARALADARRWSGTLFVGSSVADGKLRDLVVAPWTGSWGDDTLLGGAVQYRLGRFWRFFMVDLEAGAAYRFGDTEGGEFWGAVYLRYDGFPWTDYVYTTFGLSMGPDYVTRLPRVERGTDLRPEPNQSNWLNFFSPELTVALPDYPQYELAFRYMHRSGIFGTYNGVYEGANSFVLGFRYRF
ncbi:hypothetical protein J5Y09_02960 [Roseomonas sp. PWR1]|uniref:Porin family protein n=1 Tax=Roseomonas nitratireducens TaxID=2820810 RepID=A0ABS4ANC8_9PROT|nr:hypothetical protein [Neoroseomonas nitratireducens]MBP0462863.1 hypothetical protein [Neoroseomonas nitratireducens]